MREAILKSLESEKEPEKKLYNYFTVRARKISELWNFYQFVIDEYFLKYTFIMQALAEYNDIEQTTIEKIFTDGRAHS